MIDENRLMADVEYYISHTKEDAPEHYAYERCKELVENQPKVKILDLKRRLTELKEQAEKDMELSKTNTDKAHNYGKHIAYYTCIKMMEEIGF